MVFIYIDSLSISIYLSNSLYKKKSLGAIDDAWIKFNIIGDNLKYN